MKSFSVFLMMILAMQVLAQKELMYLDHSVYDTWNYIYEASISNDGAEVSYIVRSQKPNQNGTLFLYHVQTGKMDSFQRAKRIWFSPESNYLAFRIEPEAEYVRQLKLKKTKKDKLPKDSLAIIVFGSDSVLKFPGLSSYALPKEAGDWLAALVDHVAPVDTINQDSIKDKKKTNKPKQIKTDLLLINPLAKKEIRIAYVDEYFVGENGDYIVYKTVHKDSIVTSRVYRFITQTATSNLVFETVGSVKNLCIDKNGQQMAFLLSMDSTKVKNYQLYYGNFGKKGPEMIVGADEEENFPSKKYKMWFNDDNTRLFYGLYEKEVEEPKDTLLDSEKASLDVWNWKDLHLQPEQLKKKKTIENQTWICVYDLKSEKNIQLGSEELIDIKIFNKGMGDFVVGIDRKPYARSYTWESNWVYDAWMISLKTGKKEHVIKGVDRIRVSPQGKFAYWYSKQDSNWHTLQLSNFKEYVITGDLPNPLYQEIYDTPDLPYAYGIAGWDENDQHIYIYDRYDIWKVDPQNKDKPLCLSQSYGRKNQIRLRNIRLDRDEKFFVKGQVLLLKGFDESNNSEGYYSLSLSAKEAPQKLLYLDKHLGTPRKAKNASTTIFTLSDYNHFPDIRVSDMEFNAYKQISRANPQINDYYWGKVEVVKWTDFEGVVRKGLLYYPGNFDPSKKYPMIVYYYERNSESQYRHYVPKPSYSVISFPMYTSNGYFIFVPDIFYKTGFPGKSAYNAIMSGTLAMCEKPFINRDKLGLQGQSWGGYQTAYMVTQTNLFAAAMGGAVVSNMTSAYGGIRWGTGVSRMFQYEKGQSRIGKTLWEARDLYIENSPVFFADRVETPLLLMHNDHDGAVPWYQGIEYFGALRRLNKPVWMLQYNGEEHNLRQWPNRVDLSIRMLQFFDFYLKDAPEPVWMKEGVPAVKKGKTFGYELSPDN